MQHRLGQFLLALIAITFVADPVMACCFPTLVEAPSVVEQSLATQDSNPPCHGSRSAPSQESEVEVRAEGCEGCNDCASFMAATELSNQVLLAGLAQEQDIAPLRQSCSVAVSNDHVSVPDIPSGPLLLCATTPISLKQKLHI